MGSTELTTLNSSQLPHNRWLWLQRIQLATNTEPNERTLECEDRLELAEGDRESSPPDNFACKCPPCLQVGVDISPAELVKLPRQLAQIDGTLSALSCTP